MAVLQATGIADLTTTTLNELGEMKFTDIMSNYQKTVAFKRVVKKNKITFDAGPQVQFNLITDHNSSAAFVGLYGQDNVNPNNVMLTGLVDWRHVTWNWGIERREVAMNRTPRKIVDLVKTRRIAALGSAVVLFEQRFWRAPASTDTLNPYGLPYWIVKSNTAVTTNDGFNGAVPSGFTLVGNINPTTYSRWQNYATQYTAVTKIDLIRKMRRAMYYTDFEPLVDEIPQYNTGDDYAIYTNYSVLGTLEEILEAQNDDLGTDIASMDGKTTFRRTPLNGIKELDLDTTNPVIGVDWGEMKTMGLRGEWLNETQIPIQPGQHTVSATHTDCSFNWFCRNRRRNWILATDTTAMP